MPPIALLQGTLELLILRTLALGPRHGVGIADRIAQVTHDAFHIKAGSLFPALRRLENEGWIAGAWGESPTGRPCRLYTLTKSGQKQLTEQKKSWERIALAIQQVLKMS